MAQDKSGEWSAVIRPARGWLCIDLAGLWAYRDLVLLLVRRDFVAQYKQTLLGPLWYVLQPLLTTLIYTVIFGHVAGLSTDGLPKVLFYLSGVVAWRYFADCLVKTSDVFRANAAIFGKVYFPRLAVPVSIVISNLTSFALHFGIFLCVMAYYALNGQAVGPTWAAWLFPLLLGIIAALGLGCGILVSSLTTRYRDLSFLVGFGVQLFMYATPVIYPLSMVPERYRWVMELNPMTAVIEACRFAFLGTGSFSWAGLGQSAATALAVLALGLAVFGRVEKNFMDTI